MPVSLKNILHEVVRLFILLGLDHCLHVFFSSLHHEMGNPHKALCCTLKIPCVLQWLTDIMTVTSLQYRQLQQFQNLESGNL